MPAGVVLARSGHSTTPWQAPASRTGSTPKRTGLAGGGVGLRPVGTHGATGATSYRTALSPPSMAMRS